MAVGTGYSKIASSGLVFAYDSGDSFNSYIGEPTTNYWNGNQFSIYNDGATNIRNSTDVAPPVPGYEVVKVTANNIGTYGQCILWNATYPNNNVATITNSIYAYLTVGDYVQVGQHWFPWYYGTQKAIAKNQWVRISETYAINEGNSYGNAALTYSTNGIAYFAMPQYEYKSYITPFIGANQTRSNTQALLDISGGGNTNTLTNMSYNNSAMFYFDGTDDRISIPSNSSNNVSGNITMELIVNRNPGTGGVVIHKEVQYTLNVLSNGTITYADSSLWSYAAFGSYGNLLAGQNNHLVATKSGSLVTIYLNGNVIVSQNFGGAISQTNNTLYIGSYDGSGGFFSGQIPVAKIYNRPLTASEISDNYSHYKTRFNLP
jgi:hypothetical protein